MNKYISLIFAIIFIYLSSNAQTTKTVNVSSAGTLSSLISSTEQMTITNLTVSGNIDARDVAFIRDKIKNLSVLNLNSSKISLYVGTSGTYSGTSIMYPANEMPMYSFYNINTNTFKPSLTSVILPATITSIGYLAFYYCWNISGTFTIPATVKKIGDYALYGCTGISNYNVETSNTRYSSSNGILYSKAQDSVFICPTGKAGAISIPSTVTWIGPSAYEGCTGLTGTVTLPSSLTKIADYAFYACTGLTGDLSLPATLTDMGNFAFYNCSGLNGTISIQKNLIKVGNYPFLLCDKLTTFNVNSLNPKYSSVNGILYSKNIDTLITYPASKSGNFIIPATVKVLAGYSLYDCSLITGNIDITSNIDSIGNYAFFGCSQISSFSVASGNKKYSYVDSILFSYNKSRLLVCPALKTGNYTIPSTVQRVEASAFCNCSKLTGIMTIPVGVKFIGDYAFYGCDQISAFDVPAGNTRYSSKGGLLFSKNQDSLFICPSTVSGKYSVPSTVKYIGYSAFDGCSAITELDIPSSVNVIDNYAFENCTGLIHVRIHENINTIGSAAFFNCSALQKLEIMKSAPPTVDFYTFDQVNKSICNLVVPINATINYQNANYWSEFSQISESNFTDTATPKIDQRKFKISVTNDEIVIEGFYPGENIIIYDLSGKIIHSNSVSSSTYKYHVKGHGVLLIKPGKYLYKTIY